MEVGVTDPSRRRFLVGLATVPALPAPDEPAVATDGGDDETASDMPARERVDPLDDLYSSLYAEGTFDESVTLDPRTGEKWTGEEWVPVVDLSIEFGMGDVAITLDEEAGRALAEQLLATFDESA